MAFTCYSKNHNDRIKSNEAFYQVTRIPISAFLVDGTYLLVDSIRSYRVWAQSHKTRPPTLTSDTNRHLGCPLYFWVTVYRSEISTTLSSVSSNLIDQFTELRETFTYVYQFIIKGYYKRYRWIARWRSTQGKVYGKGAQSFPLSLCVHHSPSTCMCSPTWKPSKPHPLRFLWRVHYVSMIG